MPVRALKGSLHNKSMEPHSLRRSAMTCSDSALSHARTQPSNWKQILVCGFRRPRERKSGRPVPLHDCAPDSILRSQRNSASKHECLCLAAGLAQWQSCSSQLCSSITAPHSARPISPTSAVAFAPLLARLTGTPIGHVLGRAKEVHEREQYSKPDSEGSKPLFVISAPRTVTDLISSSLQALEPTPRPVTYVPPAFGRGSLATCPTTTALVRAWQRIGATKRQL